MHYISAVMPDTKECIACAADRLVYSVLHHKTLRMDVSPVLSLIPP